MAEQHLPTIDNENPFYCPTVSPTAYLATLRRSLQSNTFSLFQENSLFAWKLNLTSTKQHQVASFPYVCASTPARSSVSGSPSSRSPWVQSRKHASKYQSALVVSQRHRMSFNNQLAMRPPKRTRSSSAIGDHPRPFKRTKSSEDDQNISFEASERKRLFASSLSYDDESFDFMMPEKQQGPGLTGSTSDPIAEIKLQLRDLKETVYGPFIGEDIPEQIPFLTARLYSQIGIDILQKLHSMKNLTHQKIANVLASNGYLSERVLNVLRASTVYCLDLSSSMNNEGGLNLSGQDVLRVLDQPHSFRFLSELCLSGTSLRDSDLVHIQRLSNLRKLLLESTGIGNEAIFLLTGLKQTLTHLYLAFNPKINNDAIPVLEIFLSLSFLSLFDTGIDMSGLRRLALVICKDNRVVDIEIPVCCEEYIDNLQSKYMINPRAPLIVDSSVCAQLSEAALARNLAAHAKFNTAIVASGTKIEMIERLVKILETREMDLVVRDMLWGDQDGIP
ncbi:hypothetical protein SERLADRAFT_438567 [Serpula lacrymans var. lacrymans S7.9]|nr:uncharacterized protein SERLADRAFT_438567 [Serpula lacrymans var. lacrymans S7.9]EGO24972.1 hypothetical protein SERLADRAFT_438567 [Serpula lacrymans var. lacrymans S7.9]